MNRTFRTDGLRKEAEAEIAVGQCSAAAEDLIKRTSNNISFILVISKDIDTAYMKQIKYLPNIFLKIKIHTVAIVADQPFSL